MKVRFWEVINGSAVRLTMSPGDVIRITGGGPHEEGHHWTLETWTCHEDHVEHEYGTHGTDCDGAYSDYVQSTCGHGDLRAIPPAFHRTWCTCRDKRAAWRGDRPWIHSPECLRPAWPKWVKGEYWRNDVEARKAGY